MSLECRLCNKCSGYVLRAYLFPHWILKRLPSIQKAYELHFATPFYGRIQLKINFYHIVFLQRQVTFFFSCDAPSAQVNSGVRHYTIYQSAATPRWASRFGSSSPVSCFWKGKKSIEEEDGKEHIVAFRPSADPTSWPIFPSIFSDCANQIRTHSRLPSFRFQTRLFRYAPVISLQMCWKPFDTRSFKNCVKWCWLFCCQLWLELLSSCAVVNNYMNVNNFMNNGLFT